MSFSYLLTEGVPSNRDRVRLLVGDVDSTQFLLHDEEIDFYLTEEPNIYFAAAAAAWSMIMRLQGGLLEDQKVGETRVRSKQIQQLKVLVDQWKSRGALHMLPDAGGIFISDQRASDANSDLVKGEFKKGMSDFPGTTSKSDPPGELFEA